MDINPGEEFRIKATPSPELARKLVYLATQENDSVLTGQKSGQTSARGADADRKRRADAMLSRLTDPAYQALSATINSELDLMDQASVQALQDIEQELQEIRKAREKMLEQAYLDEQGRRIFMTGDESAAYCEDGSQLEADEFAQVKERLRGKPTWDDFDAFDKREAELSAERDQIHRHDAERQQLREDLAKGAISGEEAKQREKEIAEAMPERVRHSYNAPEATAAENAAAPQDTVLSADELAALEACAPSQEPAVASRKSDAPSL